MRSVKLAKTTPKPYSTPPVTATTRGPLRFNHKPPAKAAHDSARIVIVKVSVICEMLQPNCVASGVRNTLDAYTEPSAICSNTPAAAILQRSDGIAHPRLRRLIHILGGKIFDRGW